MSELLIGEDAATETAEKKAKHIPVPSGFHILCMVPEVEKEFDGGIIKSGTTVFAEERLTTVLFVMELGPDCYKDQTRFPTGNWCKKGDFILVRPNTGSRLKIHGREFRIINDDAVEGIVEDPRGIARA